MKIRTTRNTVTAAMIFLVLSGLSAISHGSIDTEEHDAERVIYSDLDLSNAEGRETLIHRLRLAARNVCEQPETNSLRNMTDARECREKAFEKAMRDAGLRREVAGRQH